jgi:hypothetical protein
MKTIFIFSFAVCVSIYSGLAQNKTDFAMFVCGNYLGHLRNYNASGAIKDACMAILTVERIGTNKIRVSSKDVITFELELKKQGDKKIGSIDNNESIYFEDYYTNVTRTAANVNYKDGEGVIWTFNGSRIGSLVFPLLITPLPIYGQRSFCIYDKNDSFLPRNAHNQTNVLHRQQHSKNYAYNLKSPVRNGITLLVNKYIIAKPAQRYG